MLDLLLPKKLDASKATTQKIQHCVWFQTQAGVVREGEHEPLLLLLLLLLLCSGAGSFAAAVCWCWC
jgi:hypothetical protein